MYGNAKLVTAWGYISFILFFLFKPHSRNVDSPTMTMFAPGGNYNRVRWGAQNPSIVESEKMEKPPDEIAETFGGG